MTSRRRDATAVCTIPISDPVLLTILNLNEGRPSVYIKKTNIQSPRCHCRLYHSNLCYGPSWILVKAGRSLYKNTNIQSPRCHCRLYHSNLCYGPSWILVKAGRSLYKNTNIQSPRCHCRLYQSNLCYGPSINETPPPL